MKIPLELETLEAALSICGFDHLNHQKEETKRMIFQI
jgi:hypothetical protein